MCALGGLGLSGWSPLNTRADGYGGDEDGKEAAQANDPNNPGATHAKGGTKGPAGRKKAQIEVGFPDTLPGSSSAKDFTITNNGDTVLDIELVDDQGWPIASRTSGRIVLDAVDEEEGEGAEGTSPALPAARPSGHRVPAKDKRIFTVSAGYAVVPAKRQKKFTMTYHVGVASVCVCVCVHGGGA